MPHDLRPPLNWKPSAQNTGVDFSLEHQPGVTDEMQEMAVAAYEQGCAAIGRKQVPDLWGWPLACAIQAALNVKAKNED